MTHWWFNFAASICALKGAASVFCCLCIRYLGRKAGNCPTVSRGDLNELIRTGEDSGSTQAMRDLVNFVKDDVEHPNPER